MLLALIIIGTLALIYFLTLITIIVKRSKDINLHIHHTGNVVNTVDPVTINHEIHGNLGYPINVQLQTPNPLDGKLEFNVTQIPYHVNITDPEFEKRKPVALTDKEEILREEWKKENK